MRAEAVSRSTNWLNFSRSCVSIATFTCSTAYWGVVVHHHQPAASAGSDHDKCERSA